jgi:hypothetical protein
MSSAAKVVTSFMTDAGFIGWLVRCWIRGAVRPSASRTSMATASAGTLARFNAANTAEGKACAMALALKMPPNRQTMAHETIREMGVSGCIFVL